MGFASEASFAPSWHWAAFVLGVFVLLAIDLSLLSGIYWCENASG
jgi:hypothetical protein